MKTVLIGNGYWGNIIAPKLSAATQLKKIITSKDIAEFSFGIDIDWVFICTPTNTHYQLVKSCIESGLNVFCEKPFGGDFEKAKELYNLSDKKGTKIFVDNIFLFRDELQERLLFSKVIEFEWIKYEDVLKDDIINTLLYHDLYILIKAINKEWCVQEISVLDDTLHLKLAQGNREALFYYNRKAKSSKMKKITLDKNLIIDLSIPKNDPLSEIISKLSTNNIDFIKNREETLSTLELIKKIRSQI